MFMIVVRVQKVTDDDRAIDDIECLEMHRFHTAIYSDNLVCLTLIVQAFIDIISLFR